MMSEKSFAEATRSVFEGLSQKPELDGFNEGLEELLKIIRSGVLVIEEL